VTETVVILGCGYVGLELARQLRGTHDVVGVRRSQAGIEAIEAAGCRGVQADVTDEESLDSVPDADVIVFAASAGGRSDDAARETYVEGQRTVLDAFGSREDPPERYVYTGSTGVYGDHDGDWVDEQTPIEPDNRRQELLLEAEQIALQGTESYGIDGTVARFAGLYGPGRYRIDRYLEGPVTEGYLNLAHRDDAAGAVAHLLRKDVARGETVLVVDDEPVSKWELADWLAAQCGRPEPPKQAVAERLDDDQLSDAARQRIRANKRCRNDKLRVLGYEFAFPTFREGYQAGIEAYCGEFQS
jgi:nucleoside-diphosphate-sugar epimerase